MMLSKNFIELGEKRGLYYEKAEPETYRYTQNVLEDIRSILSNLLKESVIGEKVPSQIMYRLQGMFTFI